MNMSFVRSKKLRGAVGATAIAGMLIAMPILDTQAGAFDLPLPADASKEKTDGLDVVVGETVALTVDQNGNQGPFNVYIVNGQTSGVGSGTLEIPTGTDKTMTKDLTSQLGQVSNFMNVPGTFQGQMPLTTKTELKVNGQSVNPTEGYNLNGDVEITYSVTNHTSRQQEVTYTDIYGVQQSKVMDIPVPFGDSYQVIFGDGWDIVDTGGMTATTTGQGTSLSSTLILFPIIEGKVGGTTQSVTVKAKAQNASLPNTTHTIVPVKLGDYYDGVALKLNAGLDSKVLEPLANVATGALSEVVLAANIISGYTAGFGKLATDFIDPLVADVNAIKADPKALNNTLEKLSEGLIDLSAVLEVNAEAKDDVALLLTSLSKFVNKDLEATVEWLGNLVKTAGPDAAKAASALRNISKILKDTDPVTLEPATQELAAMCDTAAPTTELYGPSSSLISSGGPGAQAIAAGIKAVGKNTNQGKALSSLQTALNAQANGSLIMSSGTIWSQISSLPIPDAAKQILQGAACKPVVELATAVVLLGGETATIDEAAMALDVFSEVAASAEAEKVYEEILMGLTEVSLLLSNPSCTDGDILKPIVAALKKYGPSGLEAHAAEIVKAVFKDCGLAQIMTFFGDFDRALAKILDELGVIVGKAEKDVPLITNGIKKVQSLATLAGKVFDAIPVVGGEIGDLVTAGVDKVEGMGAEALAEVSSYAAQLEASIVAMNERGDRGDGAPYGNAYLTDKDAGKVKNYTVYQITVQPAAPYSSFWATGLIIAVVFLALAVGLGTFLYRRKINP